VQVDPITPTLKAPVIERLKLEYDELLSSFAFNFKLRRYNLALRDAATAAALLSALTQAALTADDAAVGASGGTAKKRSRAPAPAGAAGDTPATAAETVGAGAAGPLRTEVRAALSALLPVVGRCRLTASKPVLKAPVISALEATI